MASMISKGSQSSGSQSPATIRFDERDQMDMDSPRSHREAHLITTCSNSAAASPASEPSVDVPVANHNRNRHFLDQELIPRHSRISKVPTLPTSFNPHPQVAISVPQHKLSNLQTGQDVHSIVNPQTSLVTSNGPRSFGSPFETPVSSFPQPITQHVINHPIRRPRTSTKVFESTTDLAAHYGIPQILPPAPRTTPRYNQQTTESPLINFDKLKNNYITMLSNNPSSEVSTTERTMSAPPVESDAPGSAYDMASSSEEITPEDLQKIVDIIATSPEFRDQDYIDPEWMTSPLIPDLDNSDFFASPDETPFHDFLDTPQWTDQAMLTSPSMEFYDMNQPLISSGPEVGYQEGLAVKGKQPSSLENLIAFSPQTLMSDSFPIPFPVAPPTTVVPQNTSVDSAPASSAASASLPARRPKPTGHRHGVTPDSLLNEDAPTQPRKYHTPSATSRKEVPAVFARKRARSVAPGEEEDTFVLPPNPTEKDLIEAKRRQNTVAARRSRKRKLEQYQNLLSSRDEERFFKERWESRAKDMLQTLRNHGFPMPDFPPDEPQYADAA